MKKNLFLQILLAVFFLTVFTASNIALAQKSADTDQTESIDLAKIDYRYNALLSFFLQLTKEKNYDPAYGYMTGNFPKLYNLDDFTRIVNESGLTTFTEKKWTSFKDEMKSIGVTTVKGDFTTPDEVVHHITFFVIIGGETEIKIGYIGEEIDVAALAKRFPAVETLGGFVKQDLRQVALFVRKNRISQAYKYLSQAARTRIKLKDIRKAFRQFKKLKLNVAFPKKAQATLGGEPQLNEFGQMIVAGNYQNKTHNVNFTLAYDYEDWKWKLGSFSLTAQPLSTPQL